MEIEKIKQKIEEMKNDGSFDKLFDKIIEHEKKEKAFIKTSEFKRNFLLLKQYLKSNETFFTDGCFYTETPKEKIFANNAIEIYNTVSKNVSEYYIHSDTNFFQTAAYAYDGVGMSCMFGQGCSYKFWLLE